MTPIIRCIRAVVSTKTLLLHLVRTTTTTTTSATKFKSTFCVTFFGALAASQMMAGRDDGGVGSARRRRDRQLRAWHRHVKMTVAMELATALHHSAQPGGPVVEEPEEEVEFEEHAGLRAQNIPPPGSRPGVLKDPGPPWVEAVTVGYVAAGAPSLVVASVAAHDGLDDATVQFLLQQSLLAVAAEEEEAREREEVKVLQEKVKEKERRIVEEIDRLRGLGENDRSPLLTRTCAWYVARRDLLAKMEKKKRKRKKRSKKRLPKSSSTCFSRGVRGRRYGQGFRSRSSSSGARGCSLPSSSSTTAACARLVLLACAPRDVFPSVVGRPLMFGIMAGTYQKVFALIVVSSSGVCKARFDGTEQWRFHWCSSWTGYWPVVCIDRCCGPDVQVAVEVPQLQVEWTRVAASSGRFYCTGTRCIKVTSDCGGTVDLPQLLCLDAVVDEPVGGKRQVPSVRRPMLDTVQLAVTVLPTRLSSCHVLAARTVEVRRVGVVLVVEVFTPGGAYDSAFGTCVKPMTGNTLVNYFQYQEYVGCICKLNFWLSSICRLFAPSITSTSCSRCRPVSQ